jgi:phage FluMu gp28-like protein
LEGVVLTTSAVPFDIPNTAPKAVPGAVLLPYQQRWVSDTSQVKIVEKSRRIGISYAEAADDVLWAAEEAGANVYYISYSKEMTQSFIQDCAMWAKAFNRAASEIEESVLQEEDKQILTYTIKFDSGHIIQTFTSSPRNLRSKGRPGERLVVDEAAFLDDIKAVLKAAMAMTMWGGKIRIISTHNGEENPFNELVNDVRSRRYRYSLHRIDLDAALRDGLYQRICAVTGQRWTQEGEVLWREDLVNNYRPNEDEELFCIPSRGGGAWLSRALIESRMSADTPVLRWDCKPGFELLPDHIRKAEANDWLKAQMLPLLEKLPGTAISFDGEDFGRSGDLSVHVPLLQHQNLVRQVPFVVELRNVPFRQQEQIAFYLLDRLPRFMGGAFDARGNGQFLAEVAMQRYGASRIQQVMLTENWYREHMPPVKAALEDGTLNGLPKDADILADLRAVQVVRGVPRIPDTRSTGEDKGKRHGDAAVAVALAYFASREINLGPVKATTRERKMSEHIGDINLNGY